MATPALKPPASHSYKLPSLPRYYSSMEGAGGRSKRQPGDKPFLRDPLYDEYIQGRGRWEGRETKTRDAIEDIHDEYLNEANREDEELVKRWTETLDILLTFGGLLSALITAFLIAVQPEIKPDPMDATNKILLQILQQLDNTTTIPMSAQSSATSPNAHRVLAWWYTSLGCSIASVFGALVSKQWVMHYQSRPLWANTLEKQCRLREARYEGISRWQFFAVLETLLILPQVSLLFFGIGLADYLHPIPRLFLIPLVSTGIIGLFYIVTLLSGAFIPSCPFKSPVTDHVLGAAAFVAFWCITIWPLVSEPLVSLFRFLRGKEPHRIREHLKPAEDLFEYGPRDEAGRKLVITFGEQSLLEMAASGGRGSLCSQDQHENDRHHPSNAAGSPVDHIMPFWVESGVKSIHQRETLRRWCGPVIKRLSRDDPTSDSWTREANSLCHILHHIPQSLDAACLAVMDHLDLEIFSTAEAMGHLAKIIRRSSSGSVAPLTSMCRTTVAVYLRLQLSHWCSAPPEHRLYRENLLEELPVILGREGTKGCCKLARIDAVTVAAIALVDNDPSGTLDVEDLLRCDPLEQILRTLRWLSHYPSEGSHKILVSRVIETSWKILQEEDFQNYSRNHSWKHGRFPHCLENLSRLTHSWSRSPGDPGEALHHVQNLMASLADRAACARGPPLRGLPQLFSACLDDILAFHGRPSTSVPAMSSPQLGLRGLDYALGVRKLQDSTTHHKSKFRLTRLPELAPHWRAFSPTSPLQRHPDLIRLLNQAIHKTPVDPDLRRMTLSIIVKGRDLFFPPTLLPPSKCNGQLLSSFEALARRMPRGGNCSEPLGHDALGSFADQWDSLAQALVVIEQYVLHPREISESPGLEEKEIGEKSTEIGAFSLNS